MRQQRWLSRRGGIYYMRLPVPEELQRWLARKEILRSLKTENLNEALERLIKEVAREKQRFDELRALLGTERSADRSPPAQIQNSGSGKVVPFAAKPSSNEKDHRIIPTNDSGDAVGSDKTRTVQYLFDLFFDEHKSHWRPKTEIGYRTIHRALKELLGPTEYVSNIRREHCRRVRDTLSNLPTNVSKRPETRGLPLEAAAAWTQMYNAACFDEKDKIPTLNPKSVNTYLTNLHNVMKFAEDEGWLQKNPAKNLHIISDQNAKYARESFSLEDIDKILNSQEFLYNHSGVPMIWIVLLMIYTGARMNEIGTLKYRDIVYEDNIPVININGTKTASAVRSIPVHPTLMNLGFFEKFGPGNHVSGELELFGSIPSAKTGYKSDILSKRIDIILRKVNVKTDKKVAHSFRHTFRDRCELCGVNNDIMLYICGWKGSKIQAELHGGLNPESMAKKVYGSDPPLFRVLREIEKIHFEGVRIEQVKSRLEDI